MLLLRMFLLVTIATITHAQILHGVYDAIDSNTEVTGKIINVKVRGDIECSNR